QPVLGTFLVDRQANFGAGGDRVEETDTLDETAVTGVTAVGHGQVIERALLGAATGKTDGYHVNIVPIVGAANLNAQWAQGAQKAAYSRGIHGHLQMPFSARLRLTVQICRLSRCLRRYSRRGGAPDDRLTTRRPPRNRLQLRHAATRQHPAQATHHLGHAALGGEFLHHLLHLLVLLDQPADVLYLGAGAEGDAALARAADHLWVAALGRGHGVDDRLHLLELRLGRALGGAHLRPVHPADARQLVHQAAQAAHVLHLLQLVAEVFEVEALALLQLLGQLVGLGLVDGLLGLLDQAEHVAHAED